MNNACTTALYPGFGYAGNKLRRFSKAGALFSVLLDNGNIVHFAADKDQVQSFHEWLKSHLVIDVKDPVDNLLGV